MSSIRRLSLVLICLLLLTSLAAAYSVPDSTIVYVTPTGEKYHRKDCSYTTTVTALTIKEAEAKGYTPCSRCDPDRLTGSYKEKSSSSSSGKSTATKEPSAPSSPAAAPEPDYSGYAASAVVACTGLGAVYYLERKHRREKKKLEDQLSAVRAQLYASEKECSRLNAALELALSQKKVPPQPDYICVTDPVTGSMMKVPADKIDRWLDQRKRLASKMSYPPAPQKHRTEWNTDQPYTYTEEQWQSLLSDGDRK